MNRQAFGESVVVVVPTHLEVLNDEQSRTLLNNAAKLARYPLEIVLPETCNPEWFRDFLAAHGVEGSVRLVSADYFGGPEAVNRMGMDPNFYRLYCRFDYLLICHLDAWIFKDALDEWLSAGWDFVGAPLFLPEHPATHFLDRMAPLGGNGGLSLRRVEACISTLEQFKVRRSPLRTVQAIRFLIRGHQPGFIKYLFRLKRELRSDWRETCRRYNIYEDVFFSVIAPLCGNSIQIPSSSNALRFSCEVNYAQIQKEVLRWHPPMGVHGFDKYVDPAFWQFAETFIERRNRQERIQQLSLPITVSIIMIVKDLFRAERIAWFEQAITSVLTQSYKYVDVVIMDGGSRDGTYEYLSNRYGNRQGVSLHQREDSSVWEAMSNGVSVATGDLIGVMNSDDYYASDKAVETMVWALAEKNADFVYGNAVLLGESSELLFPTNLSSVMNCFGVLHQATLTKRTALEAIQPFSSGHITCENYLFVAILMMGFRVAQVSDIVAVYRTGGLSDELYGGENFDRTIEDYVSYMKTLTAVGSYLTDEEISELYGFRGVSRRGFFGYLKMVMKVRDRRIRNFLLRGTWNLMRARGLRKLTRAKLKSMLKRRGGV